MDLALAIERLSPGAKYLGSTTANTRAAYDALNWFDERERPAWSAIVAAAGEVDKAALVEAVNDHRERLVEAGAAIDVGDGTSIQLDLRHERDWRNFQALVTYAQIIEAQGLARTVRIRDSDNAEHQLTASAMLGLGLRVVEAVDGVYRASWAVKARIEAGEIAAKDAIPAAFDEAMRAGNGQARRG